MEGFDVRTCSGSHVGKCVDVWGKLLFRHAMSVDDGGARWKWKVEWRYVNESTVNELLTPN